MVKDIEAAIRRPRRRHAGEADPPRLDRISAAQAQPVRDGLAKGWTGFVLPMLKKAAEG